MIPCEFCVDSYYCLFDLHFKWPPCLPIYQSITVTAIEQSDTYLWSLCLHVRHLIIMQQCLMNTLCIQRLKQESLTKFSGDKKNNRNDLIAFMFRTTRWERTDMRYRMWGCLQPASFLRTNLLLLFWRWNEACGKKKAMEEAEGDKFIVKQGLAWGRMNLKSIISWWRCWTHCPLLLKAFTGCQWSSVVMVSYKEMKKTACRIRDSWLKG